MATKRRVLNSKKHIELADQVDLWARKYRVSRDPYVTGLSSSLREKKNLQIWASMNPVEYLPHPEITEGIAVAKWARLLTLIRNVLVFAPVALTWAAVGQATTAFSTYVKENGADVVNFLDFWQNGYGVLGNEWKIANVARLDFLIILVVIILTLVASVFGRRATAEQSSYEEQIERERIGLAVEITSFLFDKQKATNVTMNASLAGAIAKLLNATDALEDVAKNLAKTVKKVDRGA
jgi:uncharacterized membrane protein